MCILGTWPATQEHYVLEKVTQPILALCCEDEHAHRMTPTPCSRGISSQKISEDTINSSLYPVEVSYKNMNWVRLGTRYQVSGTRYQV